MDKSGQEIQKVKRENERRRMTTESTRRLNSRAITRQHVSCSKLAVSAFWLLGGNV